MNQTAHELLKIHTHANMLLKFENMDDEGKLLDNPSEIIYREKDVIALLVKLGHEAPVFDGEPYIENP